MTLGDLDPAPVVCTLLDEAYWQVHKSSLAKSAIEVLLQLLIKHLPPP